LSPLGLVYPALTPQPKKTESLRHLRNLRLTLLCHLRL